MAPDGRSTLQCFTAAELFEFLGMACHISPSSRGLGNFADVVCVRCMLLTWQSAFSMADRSFVGFEHVEYSALWLRLGYLEGRIDWLRGVSW